MSKITHEEFFEKYKDTLEKIEILSENKYQSRETIFKCRCKTCGFIYETKAGNIAKGHTCRKCSKTYIPSQEEFIQDIKEINPNVKILGVYKTARLPIQCKCLKCGYEEWYPTPDMLRRKSGCPACYGRVARKNENDVFTTRKDLLKYLKNKNEGIGVLPNSMRRVIWKCPDCNTEVVDSFRNVNQCGFKCKMCGDGFSYPEKIIRAFLFQIGRTFDLQKKFKWSNGKIYDFYIPSLSCIIETHGIQHYEESFNFTNNNRKSRSLKEERLNDIYKKELAISNGIKHYIELDCRESNIEYIKNSIISSDIINIINIKKIDWDSCNDYYNKSLQIRALEIWNKTNSIKSIMEELKISNTTIALYLSNLRDIGLCDYDPMKNFEKSKFLSKNVPHSTKFLRCIETNRVFNGLHECADFLKENSDRRTIDHLKIKLSCEDGSEQYGLHFEYVEIIPKK